MIKKILIILFLVILNFSLVFSDQTDDSIKSKISKTKIKIGEKITLLIKVANIKDVKVLWQDMTPTNQKVEVYSKKDFYKDKYLNFEIIFTFFEGGEYNDFTFTIPISTKDSQMMYLESDKYNIIVEKTLTEDEVKNIKDIKDPSKIELRKEKEQEKIPFHFSFYLIVALILLGVVLFGMILYYVVFKRLMRMKSIDTKNNIPPYEKFLADLAMILFDKEEDRKIIEQKLSQVSEILKELIYAEFELNAPSETTRELVISLKDINFDQDIISEINNLFNEIDMIKFAKAPFVYEHLKFYVDAVRNLGTKTHSYKLSLMPREEANENI